MSGALLDAAIELPELGQVARNVPVQQLHWPLLSDLGISCWLRRDDLLPAWGQGNKFYKLYFNVAAAPIGSALISFGGAFSNHIHALAMIGQKLARNTVGIIRGERPREFSPTLVDAERAGMRLVFVSRSQYRALCQASDSANWRAQVCDLVGEPGGWVIPEGGHNDMGLQGCRLLGAAVADSVRALAIDEVVLAVGTGTTLAGVAQGVGRAARVVGVSVLGQLRSGERALSAQIAQLLGAACPNNWQLVEGLAPGAYGRAPAELLAFIAAFERDHGVTLDQVYTGKLCWAVAKLARQGHWQPGTRLLLLHTGGLQGVRGVNFVKRER